MAGMARNKLSAANNYREYFYSVCIHQLHETSAFSRALLVNLPKLQGLRNRVQETPSVGNDVPRNGAIRLWLALQPSLTSDPNSPKVTIYSTIGYDVKRLTYCTLLALFYA